MGRSDPVIHSDHTSIFCSNPQPYRPRMLDHELKFTVFLEWARFPGSTSAYDRIDGNDGHKSAPDTNKQQSDQPTKDLQEGGHTIPLCWSSDAST